MKYVLALAVLSTAFSCTQKPGQASREIASIEENITKMAPVEFRKEMTYLHSQIEHATVHAYDALEDFDRSLDQKSTESLFENPHYANLVASRMVIEEMQDEAQHLREDFYKATLSEDLSPEDRLKSLELLRATLPPASTELDRLVHQSTNRELAGFAKSLMLDIPKVQEVAVKKGLTALYESMHGTWGPIGAEETLKINDWRAISGRAREKLKSNRSAELIRRTIEHRAQEVRATFAQAQAEKERSTKMFFPSTTKAGNIVGTEFPSKVWSLTYDDGPGNSTSRRILSHLETHGLKATFFQLTKNVKALPSIAKDIRTAGMEIASHSYTHGQVTKLSSEQRDREIRVASEELGQLSGRPIKFFRLPYGAGVSNADIRQRISNAGMIHVFWNVDTLDWMAQDPSAIVARTIKQMAASKNDAGVILFHDIHERTVTASEQIMRHLKKDGRRVCLLEEIVDAMNRGATPCPAAP